MKDLLIFQPIKTLLTPHGYKNEGAQTTIGFCSDGRFFFWIWVPILPGDKSAKGIPVYLEMFDIDVSILIKGTFLHILFFGILVFM